MQSACHSQRFWIMTFITNCSLGNGYALTLNDITIIDWNWFAHRIWKMHKKWLRLEFNVYIFMCWWMKSFSLLHLIQTPNGVHIDSVYLLYFLQNYLRISTQYSGWLYIPQAWSVFKSYWMCLNYIDFFLHFHIIFCSVKNSYLLFTILMDGVINTNEHFFLISFIRLNK